MCCSLLTDVVDAKNPRQVLLALCDSFLLSYFLHVAAQQQQPQQQQQQPQQQQQQQLQQHNDVSKFSGLSGFCGTF